MLAGMLLPLGFRIREAASGRECLESVQEHPPDAVLLDLSMDDMDGWETARRIRAAGAARADGVPGRHRPALASLPIIIVSANAFENQSEKLLEAGCQGFVDKPVIESELLVVLQRHLELEWVAELALPSWTVSAPALPQDLPLRLPDEHARTLLSLAQLGHRQGLLRALEALVSEHPACGDEAARLRALAERFAWSEMADQLASALALTDTEAH
jgi:CheY-like chemotaxis protein